MNKTNFEIVERLEKFAQQCDHTLLELALSWRAAHPVVSSVIAGATRPKQVEQNVKALELVLTPEDLAEIDRATKPAVLAARA